MRLTLKPHPDTPCEAVREIIVDVSRWADGVLDLGWRLEGDLDAILWPETESRSRAEWLWRHTCFEAFIRREGQLGYIELNQSPGGPWAMYAFEGYREGMTHTGAAPYRFEVCREGDVFELDAASDVDDPLPKVPWRLGLSAVIELKDGSKSYWALAHAPGPPDFHHPEAFAAFVPPEFP